MNYLGLLLGGIVNGLQYGLLAIGLVLVYRASRFVNVAHAQIGAIGAAVLGRLVLDAGVPYLVALVLALVVGGLTGVILERTIIQKLFGASRLTLLIATIGIAQLLFILTTHNARPVVSAVLGLVAGVIAPLALPRTASSQQRQLCSALVGGGVNAVAYFYPGLELLDHPFERHSKALYPLPFDAHITVGRTYLTSAQILTLILAPLIAVALTIFFARTQTGRNIRAAASNPEAARLAGISVRRVSLVVWAIAGVLSTVAAVLEAPSHTTLDVSALGPDLLIRGLAAALIAGMADFRVAFAAGILVGFVEQQTLDYAPSDLIGRGDLSVFLVLIIGLLLRARTLSKGQRRGDDLVGAGEQSRPTLPARLQQVHLARNLGAYGWLLIFAVLLALPHLPGLGSQSQAQNLTVLIAFCLIGLSLTVLTGWAGQLSLGQFAFLGIGAYTAAELVSDRVALPLVLVLTAIGTGVTAVIVGFFAVRFKGLFLATVTLALGVVAPGFLFRQGFYGDKATGSATILIRDVRLPFYGALPDKQTLYVIAVIVLGLVVAALASLRRSNIGRALVAVRDNEDVAASHGLTPAAVKSVALFLSGAIAGLAGVLFGCAQTGLSPELFPPALSLAMVAIVIVGGLTRLEGPILGTFAIFGWVYLVPGHQTALNEALSPGFFLLVVLLFLPRGFGGVLEAARALILKVIEDGLPERPFGRVEGADPLQVRGLAVSFGGLQAVRGVDLRVGPGEIVGIIGGNGAGKSTVMNLVSGHVSPDGGCVTVFGQDLTGLSPEYRPAIGLGRTFQDAHLYPGLTVREAVLVALDRTVRTGTLAALLGAPWMRDAERSKRAIADEAIARVGLSPVADSFTSELSTGMRRLCDLAIVSATRPGLILLDEPTAGIAQREVEQFAPLLRALRDDLGCAILIVEHDVPLMVSLCDRLYAMESGEVLASGPPADVVADPRVVAAYLGGDVAVIQRSGTTTRTKPPRTTTARPATTRKAAPRKKATTP